MVATPCCLGAVPYPTWSTRLSLHLLCFCLSLFNKAFNLCLLIAQEPKPPIEFKGVWINTPSSGSCVMSWPCWAAEPGADQKAACLWTDVAPMLHVCVTPRSYWPPNSPQPQGAKHVNVQRTVQEQRATANNNSVPNSLTRSPLSYHFSKGLIHKNAFSEVRWRMQKAKPARTKMRSEVSCWTIYTFCLSSVIYWCY